MMAKIFFDMTTSGGGDDFAEVVEICRQSFAFFCLIGGLAVNVYVQPVYTAVSDLVVATGIFRK